jgi:hypothetical protein
MLDQLTVLAIEIMHISPKMVLAPDVKRGIAATVYGEANPARLPGLGHGVFCRAGVDSHLCPCRAGRGGTSDSGAVADERSGSEDGAIAAIG